MIPQPVKLKFACGFYIIKRAEVEAFCMVSREVRNMLQFLGMTEVQARSAMRHSRRHPGEEFNFEWRQCNA